jgi:hypothetical protein
MYGLLDLLKQLTSILKHQKTPSSIKKSILSFSNELIFEEIILRRKLNDSSSSSSSQSTISSDISRSFYPYLLPIIEYAEILKTDLSQGSDVIASAHALIGLTKTTYTDEVISKQKIKEESIYIFTYFVYLFVLFYLFIYFF